MNRGEGGFITEGESVFLQLNRSGLKYSSGGVHLYNLPNYFCLGLYACGFRLLTDTEIVTIAASIESYFWIFGSESWVQVSLLQHQCSNL